MKCIWMECLSTALHYLLIQALLFCVSVFSYERGNFSIKKMPRGIRMETLVKAVCALAYNVVTTTDNFKALTAISPLSESLTSLMLIALERKLCSDYEQRRCGDL